MTVLEVAVRYGFKEVTSSVGDSLISLADRIYNSRSDVFLNVLQTLNNRFDWDCIEVGSTIKYIPKQYCSRIDEI